MPKNVYEFIFKRDYSKSYNTESKATVYIRGWGSKNPIRAWTDGELVVPEDDSA